jgi:tetratricopeptide (TPR) repeat protein
MPARAPSLDTLRAWSTALDTVSMRAMLRQQAALGRVRSRDGRPLAALALARLQHLANVPSVPERLAAALQGCEDEILTSRLLLALSNAEGDLRRAEAYARQAAACATPQIAALGELRLVRLAQRRGDLRGARERINGVRERMGRGQSDFLAASMDAIEALQCICEQRSSDATRLFKRAFRWAATNGVDVEAAEAAGMIGNVLHDLGDLRSALGWYELAEHHASRLGAHTIAAGMFGLYRGWALHEAGRRREAARAYARASRALGSPQAQPFLHHLHALVAILKDDSDRPSVVTTAVGALESLGEHARARALTALDAGLDGRAAADSRALHVAVLGLLWCAEKLAFHPTSDDERIALRMARRELARAVARVSRRRAELHVRVDGLAFKRQGPVVLLAKHPTLASLLVALMSGTLETRVVTEKELVHAGWPGEKMQPSAAKHRLHVALSSLRTKGLPVSWSANGYRLDVASVGVLR